MKLNRILLLLLPVTMLVSCGNSDPKKPENPSSTSTSITSSSSSVNPFVRHLTLDEVVETFETAKKGVKNITKASVVDSYYSATYNSETDDYDVVSNKLDELSTLYTNSVIFSTYTASNLDKPDDYIRFGKYSNEYGAEVEQYIAINDSFNKINTIDVYKKIGESNKKNIVNSVDSTLKNAEEKFTMLAVKFELIDPEEEQEKLTTFAVDSKGYYEITHTNYSETDDGIKITTFIQQKTYRFQSGQLFYETVKTSYKEVFSQTSKLNVESVESYTAEFSYSTNGEFDRSKLPEAN